MIAASRKEAKYADIDSRFIFEPIAVETLGVLNSSARLLPVSYTHLTLPTILRV